MNELMLERHSDIIDTILKWRVLTAESMRKILDEDNKLSSFRKRILRLEKAGILKSTFIRRLHKIIYPSEALLFRMGINGFKECNIRHDAVVSSVIYHLLGFKENVIKAKLPHEYERKSSWGHNVIEPDALIEIKLKGNHFYAAIEVELWRKDRKRVFEKLLDYAKAYEFTNVLYFFADRPSFESYKRRLQEMKDDKSFEHLKSEFQLKFLLIYHPELASNLSTLENAEVFHDCQTKRLGDILQ